MEEREDKLVWMQRRKGAEQYVSRGLERHSKGKEGGMAQRGKGAARQHTARRTGRHSKRGRERHAHREEKHSERGG